MGSNRLPSHPSWIEANYRQLLNAAPDAMIVVDEQGRIVLANQQAEQLFGYSQAELLGKSLEILVPARFRTKHADHRAAYFSGNPHVRPMRAGLDLYAVRKDGTEFPAEISLNPLQTLQGTMVISAIRDVSERKLAEEQVRKLNDELERAVRRSEKLALTGRLVTTIAHELNNPLDTLSNLLHVLHSNAKLDEAQRAIVKLAQEEVARLAAIARQTLAPHREARLPVVTRISALLDDACAVFQRRLQSADIQVEHSYVSEGELSLNPSELRQVFLNLIANAIDAMGKGGRLHLSVEKAGSEVVVSISDTGCGIAPEHMEAIFEPFFTTKAERGTGIGLWVTKSIVDQLGGRIEVTSSTHGKTGTCFSIFLPVTQSEAPNGPDRRQLLA